MTNSDTGVNSLIEMASESGADVERKRIVEIFVEQLKHSETIEVAKALELITGIKL